MRAGFRSRPHEGTRDMLNRLAEEKPLLSHDETMRLIRRAHKGGIQGKKARDLLVEHNMRLVAKWAAYYDKRLHLEHMKFEDLVQEGVPGLLRAIDKFDVDRGLRFSTYATWWIKQAMRRSTHDRDRLLRLPVHVSESGSRLYGLRQNMTNTLGREPTEDELRMAARERWGKAGEATMDRFAGDHILPQHTYSLDETVAKSSGGIDRSEATFLEFLEDEDAEDEFLAFVDPERLEWALSRLSPKSREIVELRHGMREPNGPADRVPGRQTKDNYGWTLEEVAGLYGVSRERVRQVQREAQLFLSALLQSKKEFRRRDDALKATGWGERLIEGRLRALRYERGMTVRELAEEAGVEEMVVFRAEYRKPAVDTFIKICDALRVQPEDVLRPQCDPAEQLPFFEDENEEAV